MLEKFVLKWTPSAITMRSLSQLCAIIKKRFSTIKKLHRRQKQHEISTLLLILVGSFIADLLGIANWRWSLTENEFSWHMTDSSSISGKRPFFCCECALAICWRAFTSLIKAVVANDHGIHIVLRVFFFGATVYWSLNAACRCPELNSSR